MISLWYDLKKRNATWGHFSFTSIERWEARTQTKFS